MRCSLHRRPRAPWAAASRTSRSSPSGPVLESLIHGEAVGHLQVSCSLSNRTAAAPAPVQDEEVVEVADTYTAMYFGGGRGLDVKGGAEETSPTRRGGVHRRLRRP